ncbi:hypothetical protein FH720_25555, partial [Bacteroides thetaiotaomicron]|nr:hypothetical protein [Bacteroides thetaiotaomicron]
GDVGVGCRAGVRGRGGHGRASPAGRCGSRHGKDLGSGRAGPATWVGPLRAASRRQRTDEYDACLTAR